MIEQFCVSPIISDYFPTHPLALARIAEYLSAAGHGNEKEASLFHPISNYMATRLLKVLSPNAVYDLIIGYDRHLKLNLKISKFLLRQLRYYLLDL